MDITYNVDKKRFDALLDRADFWNEYNVVKEIGFRFDKEVQPPVWWTTDIGKLRCLWAVKKFPAGLRISPEDKARAKELGKAFDASIEASGAMDSNIEIPVPADINPATGQPFAYLPYQRGGISYAHSRPNTLFADEMGLGKTIEAIGTCNIDPEVKRVLVICPATLKRNWRKEWLRWDVKHLSVGIVSVGKKTGKFPDTGVVIINYDLLGKWQAELRAIEWDVLISDECHYLKEGKTGRTQEVFGRATKRIKKGVRMDPKSGVKVKVETEVQPLAPIVAKRKLFLTGTPIVNRPKELWNLVHALDPQGLGANWMAYAKRYCGAYKTPFGVWDFSQATNLDELQAKLRGSFMVRRLKKDVLKDLLPKVRETVELETDGLSVSARKMLDEEKALYEVCRKSGDLSIPEFSEMSRVRKEIAIFKVDFVIEAVKEMLDETGKIVIFAHHHEVIDRLGAAFGADAVTLDGRTTMANREAAVERFQSDKSCRVFIGGIIPAGVGITLTESSTVVFAEMDWVPGNLAQAEDRCHRIGQHEQVLIKYFVFTGSLDQYMYETVIEKALVITQALDAPIISSASNVASQATISTQSIIRPGAKIENDGY